MALPAQVKSLKNLLATDLHGSMRFEVKGGGHELGDWSSCTGLSVSFDNKSVPDISHNSTIIRPGAPSFTPVTLKRALTHSGAKAVQKWLDHHAKKPHAHGETVEIRMVDSWGKKVVEWKLHNVVPKSWKGPDLDGGPSAKSVAMETLELSHDGFMETHKDRPIGGRFEVTISGESLGSWAQCDGLQVQFDNKVVNGTGQDADHTENLPGKPSYGTALTLKRPMDPSDSKKVHDWLSKHVTSPEKKAHSATVKLFDTWDKKLGEWTFVDVLPKSWKGPSLDTAKKDVAIEVLELTHGGFHDAKADVGGRFTVTIDGHDLGSWQSCDGLSITFENKEVVKEGPKGSFHKEPVPGKPSYGTGLTLKRPMDPKDSKVIADWLKKHTETPETKPSTATVKLYDAWNKLLHEWKFENVLPKSWKGPSLDAAGKQTLTEVLELSHSGFHQGKIGVGGTFTVDLGGFDLGPWTSASGLDVEFETTKVGTHGNTSTEYVNTGQPKSGPLTLSRPLDPAHLQKVMTWLAMPSDARDHPATITLYDAWGKKAASWRTDKVTPEKWSGPNFDVGKSEVATESLRLRHDGFVLEGGTGGHGAGGGGGGGKETKPTVVANNDGGKSSGDQPPTPPKKKATLSAGGDEIEFQSDPQALTIARSARYLTVPHAIGSKSLGHSRNEYRGSGASTLSMSADLLAAIKQKTSIDEQCTMLRGWLSPVDTGKAPKKLNFQWNSVKFVGYLRDLTIVVSQFGKDGKPSVAKVSLILQEEPPESKGTNPTSGGPPGRRIHVLADGDSLQSVAFREYGDAAAWRGLAAANGIDDPMRVRPGTRLALPPAV